MAVLYGTTEPPPGQVPGLPTASDLIPADRQRLELDRLQHLLQHLAAMPEFAGSGLPTKVPVPDEYEEGWNEALLKLNLEILAALTATGQMQLAYEVGRSLRDTVNPPDQHPPRPELSRVFARSRIATLQGWLAGLSSVLPPQAAAVVAASLGRWTEFAAAIAGSPTARLKLSDGPLPETMYRYLLRQGDLWLMLLTGTNSTAGLRRSKQILSRVRRRYGFMLVLLAAAVGALIYLIVTYTHGAITVLTTIATIGAALGLSAKGIASMLGTVLTKEATRPAFSLAGEAEQDAMVWAITILPPVLLPGRRVRKLRKAGIAPSSSLGNF
jgi:hypothetical protein